MSAVAPPPVLTTRDLLALPDNGWERWLIRGQLREVPMTVRNRWHSRIMVRTGKFLDNWLDLLPEPRGLILGGEVGCKLSRDPDTTVGIDVAYISADLASKYSEDTSLIDGVPILAVEILSPNDTQEQIDEKIDAYKRAGVAVIWIIDPHDRTVLVYRRGAAPELFNVNQELVGDPELPGFRVAVAQFFA